MVPVNDRFWPKAAVALKPSRMSELGQQRTLATYCCHVRFRGLSRHPMSAFRDRCNAPPLSPQLGEERTFRGWLEGLGGSDDLRDWYGCTHYV